VTINQGYASLAELRAKLAFSAANTASDTQLEQVIEASSRWIDRYTGRRFYGVAETRYYTAEDGYEIQVDDLTSIAALKTDDNGDGTFETTWASTAYILKYGENLNAALDGKPYTQIEISQSSGKEFPVAIRKGVLVQGVFGYVASTNAATGCPDPIHDAALLVAERIYKRKDAPLGVAGPAALGQQPVRVPSLTADPDIKALLDPYRRVR
jgi:hypothetical protein